MFQIAQIFEETEKLHSIFEKAFAVDLYHTKIDKYSIKRGEAENPSPLFQ